ncbi:hypothetical protein [Arthrobacter sp. TMS1-12-1]
MASANRNGTGGPTGRGRRPGPGVYRRRRLAAVLVLLVVAALAVGGAAVAGLFGGQGDATEPGGSTSSVTAPPYSAGRTPPSAGAAPSTASASPRTTPAPSPNATTTGSPSSGRCPSAAVTVAAATDKGTYGPGENPVLSLVIRNGGTTACTANVGSSQMEFVLTRGGERVFSSVDCQGSPKDLDRTLQPGGEERATLEWTRNRTVPGCAGGGEEPPSGSYVLTTRLGAGSSAPVTFTLR